MHYIQNPLNHVGIVQNSHLMPFCHLWDTDIGKENERAKATWKNNVEKQHGKLISNIRGPSKESCI